MAGEDSPTQLADRVLADRYEFGELLGAGGMAQVHRGHDRVLKRDVAIKLLDGRFASDDRFLRLFAREARSAAGLVHPHVVTVFDTGVDGDEHFIVMELVEGETLRDLLAREAPLDPERARRLAIDVARALTAAHGRGLVHRDVKPGNVLLDGDGKPKVADFGIAHPVEEQPGDLVLGTAAYIPPEQARGRPATPASDVYSLGCVLYEMLTGRPPFGAGSAVAVAARHLREAPPPVREVRPGVPPPLASVVERALRKQPRDRPRDASEMLAALEGAATPRGLRPRPRRGLRRRTMAWVAAAVLATAGVVVVPPLLRTSDPSPVQPAQAEAVEEVRVPDVVGLSEEEAGELLRKAGLTPVFRGGALGDGVGWIVVSQDPAAGTRVAPESFVTLGLDLPGGDGEADERGGAEGRKDREGGDDVPRSEEEGSGSGSGGSSADGSSPSPSPSPTPSPTGAPSPEAE